MAEARGHSGGRGRAVAIAIGSASARRRVLRYWPERLAGWRAALFGAFLLEIDRRRLFLWLPVAFGAGIVAYFQAESEPALVASALPAVLALGFAVLGRRRLSSLAFWLGIAALFAGFSAATIRARLVAAPVLAAPVFASVDGRIEAIDRTVYGARVLVQVSDMSPAIERMPERIRVTVRGRVAHSAGDAVRFRARLTPPQPAAVPGGFDFQREAYFQRIGAVGYVTGGIAVRATDAPVPRLLRLIAGIDRMRDALTERIIAVVGGSTGAIAAALITGKRGQIAEADNDSWRAAGIYHLISISGLHMMLAAGLFFWSARAIFSLLPGIALRHPTKKWAALIAMAGAIAYDIFSGSEVATERSLIMTLVMFGAILFDRPALAMRNLAISGLLIMAIRPETVLGPSFQMSFGAVAGLVAYGEIERRWHERGAGRARPGGLTLPDRLMRLIFAFILTSLIAGLATAPFQAYHFHRLNPYGILGNALSVPVCSFIVMPSALIGVLLHPLGLDAPAWWVMGQGIDIIQHFARWVAGLGGSVAMVPRFSAGSLALMTMGLMLATLMTTAPFRVAGLAVAALGFGLAAGQQQRPDLILDASGRTAMVRSEAGTLVLLGRQKPAFALQQWLAGDRDARSPRDAGLVQGATCDRLGCTASLADGRSVALVLDKSAFAEDCERAPIIITPLAAPAFCRESAELYDRDYFAAYGASYIYPDGRHETATNARIDRPWAPKAGRDLSDTAMPARSTPPLPAPSNAPAWAPEAPDPMPDTDNQ